MRFLDILVDFRLDLGQISFRLRHGSLAFLPLESRFSILARVWAEIKSPFLYAAVIDLLLGLLAVKNF